MEKELQELKNRMQEINDLYSASAVLGWDQATYMPSGGAPARGRQMATLSKIAHEKFTDPAIGKLLDKLQPYGESLPYESDDAATIRAARRGYERSIKVPSDFVAEMNEHGAESYQAWTQARPENNFRKVQPYLERTLEYSRKLANFFPGYENIIDPLIDFSDYGMKASSVSAVFSQLREQLVPMVRAITSQEAADDSCLKQNFALDKQEQFAVEVVKAFGYDFERGRLDKTHHPFATKFSIGDVRITTRYKENDFGESFFSTTHESGHAMYEQGINPAYEGTVLDGGVSAGVHESQSRTWENIVSRSLPFWEHYYPKLQAAFPDQFKNISLDQFYRAINKVQKSLVRTDADEVTYNLHVMLRFDFEMQLLNGKLEVKDLAEAWHERYETDLGVAAPDDRDGVLQDVHWYFGQIGGAFQGYTLGNILSAQFYSAALQAHPEIPAEISQGKFATLHGWLRENIYQYGSKFTAPELIERVTGGPLNIDPYITYLKTKYGMLYKL